MPGFDDLEDGPARRVLADCFPGREIVQVDALDIVQGGGESTAPPSRSRHEKRDVRSDAVRILSRFQSQHRQGQETRARGGRAGRQRCSRPGAV